MNNDIIEKIIRGINVVALISFVYTVLRNIEQSKLEKKTYWYRERIIKVVLPFIDELEEKLDDFIIIRNKKDINKSARNKPMKDLKEYFRVLRNKVSIIKIFDEHNKNEILKEIEEMIENGENKFFNLENNVSLRDSINFCNELVIKIYMYEKFNYKSRK